MEPLPTLLGIAGYAGAGKDTLANSLADRGYQVVHFAEAVRRACQALNPIIGHRPAIYPSPTVEPVRWAQLLLSHGYASAKKHPRYGQEFRAVMQRMGTEVGRNVLYDDVWIDALAARIRRGDNVVVADVRFPNEARWIHTRGGAVVRVQRPGVGPVNDHDSETALDEDTFAVTVTNNREPEWMLAQLSQHWAVPAAAVVA